MKKESTLSVLLGAAFLMATSAIGPGFLTQTVVFTSQQGADFGFAILAMIIIDAIAQLNAWRIIAVARRPGQDIANMVLPGLGYVVSALVCAGGLAFNIGNVGGAGLGLNVLFGISPHCRGAHQFRHCHLHLFQQIGRIPDGQIRPDRRGRHGAADHLCGADFSSSCRVGS